MTGPRRCRRVLGLILAGAVCALLLVWSPAYAGPPTLPPELEKVRAEMEKLEDPMRLAILLYEPLLPQLLPRYDLHIWLWKENAVGLFSPTNRAMTCGAYGYSLAEDAPHVAPHPKA
jgi:hypothetical protein